MSCNLLLVEDDHLSRRNLTIFLKSSAHHVYEAATGHAAVELMSRVPFDVVVSDFRLPGGINGIDVLRHHAAAVPQGRRILLTAFGSDQVRTEALRLGALYHEKPLSLNELLASVQLKP
jgi:DNA-binding response OmpR family regulator